MTTDDAHWVITLYERYVALYGDPIEQPIHPRKPPEDAAPNAP